MYWFRSGDPIDVLPFLATLAAASAGGWLLARTLFRLEPRERLVTGAAVGLVLYLFMANLAGRWIEPGLAFGGSGLAVLLLGLAGTGRKGAAGWRQDLRSWPLLIGILAAMTLFTLMGRGLAILDDRKNVSIISLMAAGDIPVHFYMNPVELFRYHYGFQLLGASAVRLGGMFPWSAFDLAKGMVAALSLGLGYLVGFRLTHRSIGGWATAGTLLLAGGARWLLLLLPPGYVTSIDSSVELWGSAAANAGSLSTALTGPWVVEGGPPVPIPFAYVNGILQPHILTLQAGPISLAISIMLLMVLLPPRQRRWTGVPVLAALGATWALAWEAWFVLYAAGILLVALWTRAWRGGSPWRRMLWWATLSILLAGVVSLVQGGTITEMAKAVLTPGGASGVAGGTPIVSLRWPPAIVSSHLGELRLDRPVLWPLAVLELGGGVVAGALVLWRTPHWTRQRRMSIVVLIVASVIGFIAPILVRYSPDRDVTRFTAFSLLIWILLSVPVILQALRRSGRPVIRLAAGAYFVILNLAGVMVLGSLLTAMPRGVLTEDVASLDAGMASKLWDSLPENALVFDSRPWRAVPLTGRLTRTSDLNYEPLDSWLTLVRSPSPSALAGQGFTHVYADAQWWRGLPEASRAAFREDCVTLLMEGTDNGDNGFRRVFDITACTEAP